MRGICYLVGRSIKIKGFLCKNIQESGDLVSIDGHIAPAMGLFFKYSYQRRGVLKNIKHLRLLSMCLRGLGDHATDPHELSTVDSDHQSLSTQRRVLSPLDSESAPLGVGVTISGQDRAVRLLILLPPVSRWIPNSLSISSSVQPHSFPVQGCVPCQWNNKSKPQRPYAIKHRWWLSLSIPSCQIKGAIKSMKH